MAKLATIDAWKRRQEELRGQMLIEPLPALPRFVAGVDCAFTADKKHVLCAALVWDRQNDVVVDYAEASRPVEAPYVPGFLSFREGPAVSPAVRALTHEFGAVLFDGQGYAHPRRCGFAAHMSVELDVVGAGVGKSRLIGTHADPGPRRGDQAPLVDKGECIGAVLRTRERTRPLYVSIGNRIDLESAVRLVLACCTRYRLPEPTRLADRAVSRMKRERAGPARVAMNTP